MTDPRNMEPGERGRDAALLLSLTAAALLLRFFRIGAESLWLDEAYSWHLSSADALSTLTGSVGNRHTPPLYYFLLHFWMYFGSSETVLRSLSALFGALSVPLAYGLGRDLLGRAPARIGAALFAFAPFLVYYGQEARGYTLLVFLVLLLHRLLLRYVSEGRARDGALFALVAVISLYTHYYAGFVLVAANVFAIVELRRRRGLLARWLAVQALIAGAYAPWIVNLLTAGFGGGQIFRRFLFSQVPYSFLRFTLGYGLLPLSPEAKADMTGFVARNLPLLAAAALSFGALLAAGVRSVSGRPGRFLLVHLLVPVVLALAVSLRSNLISERYLIVTYPCFALFLAAGFGAARSAATRTAAAAAIALTLFGLGAHYFNPRAGKADWREAAALVGREGEAGDVVLLAPSFIDLPFCYYFDRREGPPMEVRGLQSAEGFDENRFEREWETIGRANRWWLVASHTERTDFYRRLMGARGREIDCVFLPEENGITISLFERGNGR
ncbi:MAG: glycosyltransferase family 39 protein [Candidatus Eisenbacteria bacterium]